MSSERLEIVMATKDRTLVAIVLVSQMSTAFLGDCEIDKIAKVLLVLTYRCSSAFNFDPPSAGGAHWLEMA